MRRFRFSHNLIPVITALAAVTVSGCSAPRPAAQPVVDPCDAAVKIMVARGTYEPPGEGQTGTLAKRIEAASTQRMVDVAVDYPAQATSWDNYVASSSAGATSVKNMLTEQVGRCPNQKIVLLGYSQGAQIIGDALGGGGGGRLGPETPPVPHEVSNRVAAVILMGDPRHMADQPFTVGTATRDGRLPRELDQQLTPFAERVRSYCDAEDRFCDSGRSVPVHMTYLGKYSDDATTFVVSAIGG